MAAGDGEPWATRRYRVSKPTGAEALALLGGVSPGRIGFTRQARLVTDPR